MHKHSAVKTSDCQLVFVCTRERIEIVLKFYFLLNSFVLVQHPEQGKANNSNSLQKHKRPNTGSTADPGH